MKSAGSGVSQQAGVREGGGTASQRLDIRLEGVTKSYGPVSAVKEISLTIESGEFFSLLGPSGCGKTTTLSMIGGFEEPTSGAIYLGGTDVSRQPPYRRDINTVFQSYALFPHLDVYENVAFGLRRKRVAAGGIDERVREMLGLVDLTGFEKRKPIHLSGGQQQRVALARALVNRPKLLLLDEPLGALDLKLRKQMQLELKRIQADVGITFLYVTHDQEEAMVMSDRLAVMSGGRIQQVGPPNVVYDNPATEFVAGFLGASNLIPGEVVERGGEVASVRLDDGTVVRLTTKRLGDRGPQVKVGVRPEKIQVLPATEPVADHWNRLDGVVGVDAYIGVSHQYAVEGPGGRTFSVYAQNLGERALPHRGDRVHLVWHPEHTFVVEPSPTIEQEEPT
ncbi:MAG: ABC transporter ATP-binding protein [Arenicellales bacterium]